MRIFILGIDSHYLPTVPYRNVCGRAANKYCLTLTLYEPIISCNFYLFNTLCHSCELIKRRVVQSQFVFRNLVVPTQIYLGLIFLHNSFSVPYPTLPGVCESSFKLQQRIIRQFYASLKALLTFKSCPPVSRPKVTNLRVINEPLGVSALDKD